MNQKQLFRSNNKILGGVCGGIAERFNMDPTVVRIIYLILSIISAAFPGTIVYIILWIVMPPAPKQIEQNSYPRHQ